MNILRDPLFPVVTRAGRRNWVSFPDLAVIDGDDAPVVFDWPRADLNVASYELAIGLAALLFQPQSTEGWNGLWDDPPSPDEVRKEAQDFVGSFELLGDGPLFMQDFEALTGEMVPIEALLIDTPGANGQKKNADLLTWRDRYPMLGLPAAAMALYALQQFAPSGGAGNRTSMRGGGPLTTLVTLQDAQGKPAPLWRVIIANLPLLTKPIHNDDLCRALPWLAGHVEGDVHASDQRVHELQAFFGMPRRIRLIAGGEGVCPMTGLQGPLIAGFVQKPCGVNYGVWEHPLTPYRRQKEDGAPYSMKPKSGHFGYRDWVAVVYGTNVGTLTKKAKALALSEQRSHSFKAKNLKPALLVAGWAMSNMEAIAYLHEIKSLYMSDDPSLTEGMSFLASGFAEAAEIAHHVLRMALRDANFARGATVSADAGLFEQARTAFYERTETDFHALLGDAFAGGGIDRSAFGQRWLARLRNTGSALFDEMTPDLAANPEKAEQITKAWRVLQGGFAGAGKSGADLFKALDIPVPAAKPKNRKVK